MEFVFSSENGALPVNEDAGRVWDATGLFAVCDGLSVGKGGGEVAAKAALDALGSWADTQADTIGKARTMNSKMVRDSVAHRLSLAFQEASHAVFQAAHAEPRLQSTCTTMDALLLLGSHALVAHVGSGRVYLVRGGELHQLTEDHTQLAHLRRTGKLADVSEAERASSAKRLLRAVGFREEVQVDLFPVELEAGDRFVLLTDGVWSALPEEELEKLLLSKGKPREILSALHARVGVGKAKDNFSTLILDPAASAPAVAGTGAEAKIKMLGTVPAFSFLTYQELIRVINTGELVKLGAGQELWKEGASGDEMMLILSGAVDIVKNGKKLNSLKKGDVLGEMSMIDSAPRSAGVVTTEATNLLAFPREALYALLREEKELAVKFLWGVTMEMNKRLRAVSAKAVGEAAPVPQPPNPKAPLPFHRNERSEREQGGET
jgi:serine/threonine protein phosphatase PrpC